MARSQTYIINEFLDTEAREYFVESTSQSFVTETEERLYKRNVELNKKIEKLKYSSLFTNLSDDARERIIAEIRELENCVLVETHVTKVESIGYSSFPKRVLKDAWIEAAFITERLGPNIYYRAIHFGRKVWDELNRPFICLTPNIGLELPDAGFNKDSLCHFQNCPVPPPKNGELPNCAQDNFKNLLTKGRFVCINKLTTQQFEEGVKWIKLTIGRMNGPGPCAMLLQRYPEKLGNCFKNYTNSSEGTPKSWKKLYQSYSGFKPFFLAVHILRHMNNFAFYSLSLSFAEKRNSMHACMRMYGDIN